ncbi:MAG: SufE family protein [Anaerolineae bacterium]|nr:SufE family protein [Anaerolineae bacterium]
MTDDYNSLPPKLAELVADFSTITDRAERTEMLIHYADQFQEVPASVATRPFPEANHVDYCESEAYVWAVPQNDGGLRFYFAVENPQGLSAKAMAAILDQTISGLPAAELTAIPGEIVRTIFGREISMGKGQGLMGIVMKVQHLARQYAQG